MADDKDLDVQVEQGELDDETVVLIDADGNEIVFTMLAVIELDPEGEFALLTPSEQLDEPEDSDAPMDVYVFHYEVDDEGMENFAPLDDDELLGKVEAVAAQVLSIGEE